MLILINCHVTFLLCMAVHLLYVCDVKECDGEVVLFVFE